MRIDEWLYAKGYFESRSRAKTAIRKGFVLVNGKKVKPSYDVKGNEKIDVLTGSYPAGYFKLMELDALWDLFTGDEVVLDLGSSAGGFLLYTSEKAKMVFGIEYSMEFEGELRKIESEKENVKIFIADAFTFDISLLPELDLILCDMTLEPEDALKALNRFLPRLKKDRNIVFVSKEREMNFDELQVIDSIKGKNKKEWYYLLRKIH